MAQTCVRRGVNVRRPDLMFSVFFYERTRPLSGFPATNREVVIPYIAFYRFDAEGKLASERLTLNWGALSPTPPEWPFD